jgi:hypothetical protein
MTLKELKNRPELNQNQKLYEAYIQFDKLLKALITKELSNATAEIINDDIDKVNSVQESDKALRKVLKYAQSNIINLIEKQHKLVTKNHYRKTWLALGMAVFGIPLGVAFGVSLGNMALLGIGLPIGMVIGMAVGTAMDKKAFEEGRQIDLEIKY